MRIPKPILVLVALGALIWGVERLIVTDEEAIRARAGELEAALNAGRYDRMPAFMTEDFRFEDRDAATTAAYAQRMARRYRVTGVSFRLSDIQVDGDRATAKATIRVTAFGSPGVVDMPVELNRVNGAWLLAAFDPPIVRPGLGRP